MTTLLLRLAAPLQSWGTSSRFTRRATDRAPSKSAVIGLLAAAQGVRRTESIEHLLGLQFAVRTEQPGRLERDFQTASRGGDVLSVSTRHYLGDAVFLAAVEGDLNLLEALVDAVRQPHFPLFLGRRSCPPVGPVAQGLRDGTALQALTDEPWQASTMEQRRRRSTAEVTLDLSADGDPTDPTTDQVRDEPVANGFDPTHRQWEWRAVRHIRVTVPNPEYRPSASAPDHHDPMEVL